MANLGADIKQSVVDELREVSSLTGIKQQRIIEEALEMYLPEIRKVWLDAQKKGKR